MMVGRERVEIKHSSSKQGKKEIVKLNYLEIVDFAK